MGGPGILTFKSVAKSTMDNTNQILDDETIESVGLILTESPLTAEISHPGRVFVYPHLEVVVIIIQFFAQVVGKIQQGRYSCYFYIFYYPRCRRRVFAYR